MTIKVFNADELLDLGLPDEAPDGGEIISDRITGTSRWSVHHEVIFRVAGQPECEAWRTTYRVGATEAQDERPWQGQATVSATLVRCVERPVKVWEPVESEPT